MHSIWRSLFFSVNYICAPFFVDIMSRLCHASSMDAKEKEVHMKHAKETQKVSVKIWRDLIPKLDKKIEAACLRRDAYLSKVIGAEVQQLDLDVSVPNSEQAFAFISKRLDRLDRKLVSFTLDAAVAERLNKVCADKRIVRDAFFNRLIFWLVASSNVVDRILGVSWESELEAAELNILFQRHTRYPMDDSVIDLLVDPLWPIHQYCHLLRHGNLLEDRDADVPDDAADENEPPNLLSTDSLYTWVLNDSMVKNIDLWGLNTYLPDYEVPGTSAKKELDGEWEVLPP